MSSPFGVTIKWQRLLDNEQVERSSKRAGLTAVEVGEGVHVQSTWPGSVKTYTFGDPFRDRRYGPDGHSARRSLGLNTDPRIQHRTRLFEWAPITLFFAILGCGLASPGLDSLQGAMRQTGLGQKTL